MSTESLLGNQLLSAIKWQQFPKICSTLKSMDAVEFFLTLISSS